MLSFFKSQQPLTFVAFILFFIAIKIPFLFITTPDIAPIQNLWGIEALLSNNSTLHFLLAQISLLAQALWLNRMFHQADYHEGSSWIPAIYYVLLSSLIPQFNVFSMYTILNFILLMLFYTFIHITAKENARMECFNAGVLGGLLIVLNVNLVFIFLFLLLILYAIKSFRFNDYIVLFFGMIFPIYVALGISYLADFSLDVDVLQPSNFFLLTIHYHLFNLICLIMAAVYLLFSFISMRGYLYSVSFKRRKNLNMLIFLLIGLSISVAFSKKLDETAFSLLFIPATIFLTLLMLRIRKKRIGEILNAIFVIVIFVTNWIRVFS